MTLVWRPGFYFDSGNRPAAIASVAPTLDYRFARERREIEVVSLTDKLTYTGANGTFVGSDGFIQQATTNVPRFDHDPATGESLGLLIEEARTNLLSYSEEFDNNYWGKSGGATITANQEIAPDGTITADLWTATAAGARLYDTLTVSDGTYSFSFFVKSKTNFVVRTYVLPRNPTIGINQARIDWDLSDGTFTTSNSIYIIGSPSILSLNNGWFKCSFTYEKSGGSSSLELRIADAVSNTDEFYFWGAQLEEGSFPTSYIPTTSTTVTRAADSAIIDGTGVLTGTYTMIEKPASCAVESGGNIELQAGYTAERVMVFPAALSAQQITDIRSAM